MPAEPVPTLFLVHHADAVPAGVEPMRPLSAGGRAHAAQLAEAAAARGVKPVEIRHSGKLRARQTADAFWRACNPLASFSAARGLQPDDPPEWTRDEVAAGSSPVMLVGHMPHLARLLRLLVAGDADRGPDFPPHGIVALRRAGERWEECWRIP